VDKFIFEHKKSGTIYDAGWLGNEQTLTFSYKQLF